MYRENGRKGREKKIWNEEDARIVRRDESGNARARQSNFCSFSGIHPQPVCGRKAETAISIRKRRYRRSGAFGIFILRYAQPIRPVGGWIIVSE